MDPQLSNFIKQKLKCENKIPLFVKEGVLTREDVALLKEEDYTKLGLNLIQKRKLEEFSSLKKGGLISCVKRAIEGSKNKEAGFLGKKLKYNIQTVKPSNLNVIEVRHMHATEPGQPYVYIKTLTGGDRLIPMNDNMTICDLRNIASGLFFHNGKNIFGNVQDFDQKILDIALAEVDDDDLVVEVLKNRVFKKPYLNYATMPKGLPIKIKWLAKAFGADVTEYEKIEEKTFFIDEKKLLKDVYEDIKAHFLRDPQRLAKYKDGGLWAERGSKLEPNEKFSNHKTNRFEFITFYNDNYEELDSDGDD